MVTAVVTCANLADAIRPELSSAPRVVHRRNSRLALAGQAAALVLIVSGVWNLIGEKDKPFGLGELPNTYIHAAARFAGQPGFPEHAFVAHNGQAAVYIYHNGPERKVFMDGRLEVCSVDTFRAYLQIEQMMMHGNPAWQAMFDPTGQTLPVLIIDRSSLPTLAGMLTMPGWRLVYGDPTAGVFLEDKTADRLKLDAVNIDKLELSPQVESIIRGFLHDRGRPRR